MRVVIGTSFIGTTFGDGLRSQVDFVPSNEIARDPGSESLSAESDIPPPHQNYLYMSYFDTLCGL